MKTKIITIAMVLLASVSAWAAPTVDEGKSIFTTRCAGCHSVTKQLTGPALAGVDERRSMEWIISFVQGSQAMVRKGDKDAVALFEKFNKIPMPDHPDLTDDNIKSIVAYIKSEADAAAAAVKQQDDNTTNVKVDYIGFTSRNYGLLLTYAGLLTLLIGSLLFLIQVKALRRRMAQKQV